MQNIDSQLPTRSDPRLAPFAIGIRRDANRRGDINVRKPSGSHFRVSSWWSRRTRSYQKSNPRNSRRRRGNLATDGSAAPGLAKRCQTSGIQITPPQTRLASVFACFCGLGTREWRPTAYKGSSLFRLTHSPSSQRATLHRITPRCMSTRYREPQERFSKRVDEASAVRSHEGITYPHSKHGHETPRCSCKSLENEDHVGSK